MADATTESKADATAPTEQPKLATTETEVATAEKSASDAPATVCTYLPGPFVWFYSSTLFAS
jgi:hypothetical protein